MEKQIGKTTSLHKQIIISGIIVGLLLIAAVVAIFSRKYYTRNKRTYLVSQAMTWKGNELYDSEESLDADIGDEESKFLPDWLNAQRQMIFPNNSITKCQQLGEGQFGSVFKGKLVQGNAV